MKRLSVIFFAFVLSLSIAVSATYGEDLAAQMNTVLSQAPAAKFWQITPDEVKAMIDSKKKDFLIVDVRPAPVMYQAGHIPGAIFIPVQDIFKPENLKKLPKDKKIVLVCVTGQTQNLPVVALRVLGYNAMTMQLGMAAWNKNSMGVGVIKGLLQGAETKNYPLEK
jgi:rhodanese-related sulfurtransferase